MAVLGEGLTNVARHAKARHADIAVTVDVATRSLTLVIEDDGIGPGPDDKPGHGTVNMVARATRLGGTCTLQRRDDGGARLTWKVPLDPPS
jgi:signal transduction histidine kinase